MTGTEFAEVLIAMAKSAQCRSELAAKCKAVTVIPDGGGQAEEHEQPPRPGGAEQEAMRAAMRAAMSGKPCVVCGMPQGNWNRFGAGFMRGLCELCHEEFVKTERQSLAEFVAGKVRASMRAEALKNREESVLDQLDKALRSVRCEKCGGEGFAK